MKIFSAKTAGMALLCLFIISGFAGLIYQSVWSHYLGLTLGHAAYAQTLVLSIFMGGMAVGSWFISRHTPNWKRLILGYALIEGVIGIFGLLFQAIFVWYADFSQQSVLPNLQSAFWAHIYQWGTATLLIFPQCFLLGATFPLLSAAYLRISPKEDGQVLGGLYFTNSLGAALGALVATFVLMPVIGLPGSILTAGMLNIIVALGAWLVSRSIETKKGLVFSRPEENLLPQEKHKTAESIFSSTDLPRLGRIMLFATAISGATSFIYETGWIRLLNQALGSTVHSFELMLAAFIAGLAFGGLWIRKRSHLIKNTVRYVGYAQIWMGIAALISIPIFAQSFTWVGWIMGAVMRNDSGYMLYQWATAGISLLVMFPAAFFAGMTLPLFTMSLLRAGADERAIGRIYAANTLGSILGVIIMVHVLIALLGVKGAVTLAAIIDIALGMYLLYLVYRKNVKVAAPKPYKTAGLWAASGLVFAALAINFWGGQINPLNQVSGVFRTGNTSSTVLNSEVLYLVDGKTATVGIYRTELNSNAAKISVTTNGKPDAVMATKLDQSPASSDESTMVMLGAMPLMAHPNPEKVAFIGWGSGLSTHTLLGSPIPKKVDTIEIEVAMYEGARLFGERVERAYNDPRSHVHFEDARTFFSTGARKYDVIVSEPSNPWVSGVASLFTQEFYKFLHDHLESDGVLVQWLHTYELNDKLLSTMLLALVNQFPDVEIYFANDADLVIVAYRGNKQPLSDIAWQDSQLAKELSRVGFRDLNDVQLQYIGSGEIIKQMARINGTSPHSDYFPTVSLEAPKTRFQNKSSDFLLKLALSDWPVLDILECRNPVYTTMPLNVSVTSGSSAIRSQRLLASSFLDVIKGWPSQKSVEYKFAGRDHKPYLSYVMRTLNEQPETAEDWQEWVNALWYMAKVTIGALSPEQLEGTWSDEQYQHWLSKEALNHAPAVHVLNAYSAAAQRDVHAMYLQGKLNLATNANFLTPSVRESMITIAMLGAIGSNNPSDAKNLYEKYAGDTSDTGTNEVNLFLYYWADDMLNGSINLCK